MEIVACIVWRWRRAGYLMSFGRNWVRVFGFHIWRRHSSNATRTTDMLGNFTIMTKIIIVLHTRVGNLFAQCIIRNKTALPIPALHLRINKRTRKESALSKRSCLIDRELTCSHTKTMHFCWSTDAKIVAEETLAIYPLPREMQSA